MTIQLEVGKWYKCKDDVITIILGEIQEGIFLDLHECHYSKDGRYQEKADSIGEDPLRLVLKPAPESSGMNIISEVTGPSEEPPFRFSRSYKYIRTVQVPGLSGALGVTEDLRDWHIYFTTPNINNTDEPGEHTEEFTIRNHPWVLIKIMDNLNSL